MVEFYGFSYIQDISIDTLQNIGQRPVAPRRRSQLTIGPGDHIPITHW